MSTTTNPVATASLKEELEQVQARYASLVERAGYGIFRSLPEGRFVEVNAVLVRMLGYSSADELLALDLARDVYLDPEERPRLRARPNLPPADWITTRWKRRDGSPITVRLSVRRVKHADGDVVAFDGIVEDVTERERHDELRRRSERMASL